MIKPLIVLSYVRFYASCVTEINGPGCNLTFTINALRPIQNGRRFADDTFKCIFLNENDRTLIKISLKFVPKGRSNTNPALLQIMAGAGQATSHYLNQ